MTIGHIGPHNGQAATYIEEADVAADAYLGDTLGICALNPSLGICNSSGGGGGGDAGTAVSLWSLFILHQLKAS